MIKEEAIRFLKEQKDVLLKGCFWEKTRMDINEAFDMAVETLEQPEIIRCWECKWHKGTNFCGNFNVIGFYPNDYCSLAERKKE